MSDKMADEIQDVGSLDQPEAVNIYEEEILVDLPIECNESHVEHFSSNNDLNLECYSEPFSEEIVLQTAEVVIGEDVNTGFPCQDGLVYVLNTNTNDDYQNLVTIQPEDDFNTQQTTTIANYDTNNYEKKKGNKKLKLNHQSKPFDIIYEKQDTQQQLNDAEYSVVWSTPGN